MKILLDENLPQNLRKQISGDEVFTIGYLGWKGIENGKLLRRAADEGFDVLVSSDRGIEHEQDGRALPLLSLFSAGGATMRPIFFRLFQS